MGFMLASSVPWYLPVLFLACLGWAFAFHIEGVVNQRPLLQRLYRWTPPLMVAGLVVARAVDIFSSSSTNPEVAYVLGQNASFDEQLRLLFTGQGALEGALFAFLVFALYAPSLPSLRGSSSETSAFVRARMMTHAGFWSLLLLMFLFQQDTYAPVESPPASPTVALAGWPTFLLVALFTLLLMMTGEMLTASAHMASSGETSLLLQRAILKTLGAGLVAWACLFQTDVFTNTWWERPLRDERLAVALIIATASTWTALVHAFSTVAEGLQGPSNSQAKSLAWCMGLTGCIALLISGSTADAVHVHGEGLGAFTTGWKWVAILMFFGAATMVLPTVGFDATHHPEAWWFRITVLFFLPLGVLMSNAAWLLYPAILLSGATYPLVYIWLIGGPSVRSQPMFLLGVCGWVVCFFSAFTTSDAVHKLHFSLLSLVVVGAMAGWWLRRERQASVQ